MFLTPDEVADMTGYTKQSAQIRWLTAERFGFVVSSSGAPKVLRAVVVSRLGSEQSKKRNEPVLRLA